MDGGNILTDIEEFKLSSYNLVKELCCTTINRVSIVKPAWEEQLYIKRELYGDRRPVYSLLKKLALKGVPHIEELIYNGNTYVIEEYIDGILLSEADWQEDRLFLVLVKVLGILQDIHKHDIVHCDIKAENIIITNEDEPVILDFAIARIDYHDNSVGTETVGTAGSSAPEQYGIAHVDLRSDLFSFGKMCMELLSFISDSHTVQRKLWKETALKCTNFYPEKRFQSASEILDILLYPGMIYGESKKRVVSFKNPLYTGKSPSYAPCLQIEKKIGDGSCILEIIFFENSVLFCVQGIDKAFLTPGGISFAWQVVLTGNGVYTCSHIEESLYGGFTVLGGEFLLNNYTLSGFFLNREE